MVHLSQSQVFSLDHQASCSFQVDFGHADFPGKRLAGQDLSHQTIDRVCDQGSKERLFFSLPGPRHVTDSAAWYPSNPLYKSTCFAQNPSQYRSKKTHAVDDRAKMVMAITSTGWAGSQLLNGSLQAQGVIDYKTRSLVAGALFLPTIISGYALNETGKPYNKWFVTGHKLTAAGNLYLLNHTVWKKNKLHSLSKTELTATMLMNACFAATIVTGALLSTEKSMPDIVYKIHRTGPWVSLISSGFLLWVMNRSE
jgi:hypothetical protein